MITVEKFNLILPEVRILSDENNTYIIIFLFNETEECKKFFELLTKNNKQPSLHFFKTFKHDHRLLVDFSYTLPDGKIQQQVIVIPIPKTLHEYPPLGWISHKKNSKTGFGVKRQGQLHGMLGMDFHPEIISYHTPDDIPPQYSSYLLN
jgi:hypothetical protein